MTGLPVSNEKLIYDSHNILGYHFAICSINIASVNYKKRSLQ